MYWLSGSADELIALARGAEAADVIVVGSGYGGAVAALRFAEAGQKVLVLERGAEYLAGEFPNDFSQAGGHVRAEISGSQGVSAMGYETALFDFRLGDHAGALVGNGLGGGSLINAAVGIQPDERVFRQPEWPAALREEDLSPWFDRARAMLEVRVPVAGRGEAALSFDVQGTARYRTLAAFARAAEDAALLAPGDAGVRVAFQPAPLAIEMRTDPPQSLAPRQPCVGCGDCVTGCNHDAKLSLAKTYLPAARAAGARMFTGVTVHRVLPAGDDDAHPWIVEFQRTGDRKLRQDIEAAQGEAAEGWLFRLRARRVVLAAGTFGSTEILLRSQRAGLSLPDGVLGRQVSGNGDDLAFAWRLPDGANALGRGSLPADGAAPGPTITGVVRFTDPADVRRDSLLQDGATPGLLAPVASELLATLGLLASFDQAPFPAPGRGDPFAPRADDAAATLPLLGMAHDNAGGIIRLDTSHDRVTWQWPDAGREPAPRLHAQRAAAVEELGGRYLRNPANGLLPEGLTGMMSGPTPGGALFTVHPLGGCRMADDAARGVVNDAGAVYRGDGGLHDGLYVMDGSVMPGSLGANPMLTITALAERACSRILQGARGGAGRDPLPAQPIAPGPLRRQQPLATGAVLSEVLRGPMQVHAPFAGVPAAGAACAALFVQMRAGDWRAFFDDPGHACAIHVPADGESYGASRLVFDRPGGDSVELRVTGGEVRMFRRLRDGPLRHLDRWARALATYGVARWWPDLRKKGVAVDQRGVLAGLTATFHAAQVRLFEYRLQLQAADGTAYELHAGKRIEAPASWHALWRSLREPRAWRAPERRSVWKQLTEVDATLLQGNQAVASGRLAMDIEDLLRNLQPQLAPRGDMLTSTWGLLGYLGFVARGVAQTRLLDLRAPDYRPDLPAPDAGPPQDPGFELALEHNAFAPIPVGGRLVAPEPPIALHVRASHRTPADDTLRIGLVRYRQPRVASAEDPRTNTLRARSIVLVNGFAQSCRAFVAPELGEQCLASVLHAGGWDVWLLEYRVSPLLQASARFSTMDDIAAFDLPAALDHVAGVLGRELDADPARVQLFAFSHCVGSASLAMSLLGGHLALAGGGASRLAGVLLSQFHPHVVGSSTAQQRLQLACFISNVLGREVLQFTAGAVAPDLLHAVFDRVFASLPVDEGEHCPDEVDLRRHQPATTTCKRMSGLLSRLFTHRQLLRETHDRLDWYFGRTNMGVFLHGAKCVEYERLVNAEGQNAYVTDANLREHLRMPVMLLHGADNVLFDRESACTTAQHLRQVFGEAGAPEVLVVPGHAHFDCTIGRNAPHLIFPRVVAFFDRAYAAADSVQATPGFRSLALPLTGPITGWCGTGTDGARVSRVWVELDSTLPQPAIAAVTDLRFTLDGKPHRVLQTWPVQRQRLQAGNAPDLGDRTRGREADVVYGIADVEVPAGASAASVRMLGLHESGFVGVHPLLLQEEAFDAMLPRLEGELAERRRTARKADPGTLSRRRRQLQHLSSCEAVLRDAPQASLLFLAAGCRHPGVTALERERADASLLSLATDPASSQADFMLMLGDQVYVDARAGLFDTASAIERLLPRYRQAFGSPGFRALAARMPLAMVPDDHELEDAWTQEHRQAGPLRRALADNAASLYRSFQRSHGPDGPHHDHALERGGFSFYLLDTRFGRTRLPQPQLMPPAAWDRLEQWLDARAGSDVPCFIVSGAVVAPGLASGLPGVAPAGADNWQDFPAERARLLRMLRDKQVRNAVLLSCDYHCSALARIDLGSGQRAWAVVTPPLHAAIRFANTNPAQLLPQEAVPLGDGSCARIALQGAWEGQGWLEAALAPAMRGGEAGWEMRLRYRLRDIDGGAEACEEQTAFMPGRAGAPGAEPACAPVQTPLP